VIPLAHHIFYDDSSMQVGIESPPRSPQAGTKTLEEPAVQTVPQLARPWNVVVHDDPVTTMLYVVSVFTEVFSYSQAKAHELMMEVHTTGRSVVWTGDREQAELFVHKLHGKHLLAHLEQGEVG
jgi:ATP-dependent Clp protease adaptor protein ClpS